SPTRSAQRFLPRGCSQGWLFRLQPGGSFGERKFVGTRFEKTRAPEIEKRIVRLLERNLRDGARKIKLPIKRRPVQSGVGERNGFFEIVFLIRNDSQSFGAADPARKRATKRQQRPKLVRSTETRSISGQAADTRTDGGSTVPTEISRQTLC